MRRWRHAAACRTVGPSIFFSEASQSDAKAICDACTVIVDCLDHSVRQSESDGVWGGLTPDERRPVWVAYRTGRIALYQQAIRYALNPPDFERPCLRCGAPLPPGPHPPDRNTFGATCGRVATYNRGCRCVACVKAKAESRGPRAGNAIVDQADNEQETRLMSTFSVDTATPDPLADDELPGDATSNGEVVAASGVLEPPIPLADCFKSDRLKFPRKRLSIAEWTWLGDNLQTITAGHQWWWGDWLLYGEQVYGESHSQALDPDRFDTKTLSNYRYVAGRIEPKYRVAELSWTHHRIVADLEDESDRRVFLKRAAKENFTTRDLQRLVDAHKGDGVIDTTVADTDSDSGEKAPSPSEPKSHATMTLSFTVARDHVEAAKNVRDILVARLEGICEERGISMSKVTVSES